MKFEYLRATASDGAVTWDSDDEDDTESDNSLDVYLNMRGLQGWELVCVTEVEAPRGGLSGAFGATAYFQELFFKRVVVA